MSRSGYSDDVLFHIKITEPPTIEATFSYHSYVDDELHTETEETWTSSIDKCASLVSDGLERYVRATYKCYQVFRIYDDPYSILVREQSKLSLSYHKVGSFFKYCVTRK